MKAVVPRRICDSTERLAAVPLPIANWEEETFEVRIREKPAVDSVLHDLHEAEAIGAADDPFRFRVDLAMLEATMPDPEY